MPRRPSTSVASRTDFSRPGIDDDATGASEMNLSDDETFLKAVEMEVKMSTRATALREICLMQKYQNADSRRVSEMLRQLAADHWDRAMSLCMQRLPANYDAPHLTATGD